MKTKERSVTWILVSGVSGILIFLILLAVLGYFSGSFAGTPIPAIIGFLFDNAALIVFFGLIFIVADIFATFPFPANLPGPIFSATGSVLLLAFIFHVFAFVYQSYMPIPYPLEIIAVILYPLVFVIVLIAGYVHIFSHLAEEERESEKTAGETEKRPARGKTWDEIGAEFRDMIYDTFHRIREEINRK
jgi:uncharacterized membrane protein